MNKINTIKHGIIGWATTFVAILGAITVGLTAFGEVDFVLGVFVGVVCLILAQIGVLCFGLYSINHNRFRRSGEFAEFMKFTVGGIGVVAGVIGTFLALSCHWWGGEWLPIVALSLIATAPVAFVIGGLGNINDLVRNWYSRRV